MEHLLEYSQNFANICQRNLEDMFGVSSGISESGKKETTIETEKELLVSVFFTGTVFGEFIIAVDESTAIELLEIDDLYDENPEAAREEVCDAMTELLNTIVGEAIVPIQGNFPKLTLIAPRVSFGSIRYPQVNSMKSVLTTDAGEIECHLFVDMMRLSVADSYHDVMNSLKEANNMLEQANASLLEEIAVHRETQKERDSNLQQLVEASRLAGMAEVATGVLHNVGNILNSVNVSAAIIRKKFRQSALSKLERVSDLISEYKSTFANFVTEDERGKRIPDYILGITDILNDERLQILKEIHDLVGNIEHIKEIVSVQQSVASSAGFEQEVSPINLVNDAIAANKGSDHADQILVVKDLQTDLPYFFTNKHKVLQILINLIKNANDAVMSTEAEQPEIRVAVETEQDKIHFEVTDNGIGIAKDKLIEIFQMGFTTKKTGNGFGLHCSANLATELGGQLAVESDGPGKGATFRLTLPMKSVDSMVADQHQTTASNS